MAGVLEGEDIELLKVLERVWAGRRRVRLKTEETRESQLRNERSGNRGERRTVSDELRLELLNRLLEHADLVGPDDKTLLVADEATVLRSTGESEPAAEERESQKWYDDGARREATYSCMVSTTWM